ncbi:polynucleotidyl transferase [Burkholderia cenocepacia]|uniref:polynucleotidyl transferase n=1 Tax=Burkholderia cenocepacia TaxID=95486 RepID=UPI00264F2B37|nr:polynucleotidyl transferase [Burkholderia cenocepacia]MDN7456570.1 polynucleotidyl transferase [Burkholderia cenocepacia]
MTELTTDFDVAPAPAIVRAPTMNILALDLGTSCGWALARGTDLTYGTKNLAARAKDGPGQRWLKFRAMLGNHYAAAGEIHAIYYEHVIAHGTREHPNVIAAHVYGGFLAHLEAWCDVQRVRLVPVSVGTVKKVWTGRGNANKDAMVAEARKRGFKVGADEDDTADALAILHVGLKQEGV